MFLSVNILKLNNKRRIIKTIHRTAVSPWDLLYVFIIATSAVTEGNVYMITF